MFLGGILRASYYLGLKIRNLESYSRILQKLEGFIRQFYKRQLMKGAFLFLFFGGLLLLVIGALEYFLWLSSGLRTLLLWTGMALEGYLLVRYILIPLLHLLKLKKGLSYKEGSRLIGKHFTNVNDKLFNLLELSESEERTELLLASIEQRSRDLVDVPFQRAIQMKEAYRYAQYAAIPVVLYGLIWISGKGLDFMSSYRRVVNYQMAYEPPAPFRFQLLTPELRQREDTPFVLKVSTPGEIQPDQVTLVLEGSPMIMEQAGPYFEYTFRPPLKPLRFHLEAGGITSRPYELEVIEVPVIDRFEMLFSYPPYLGLADERIQGSGNSKVPEGTRITWNVRTVHSDSVLYADRDTTRKVAVRDDAAQIVKRLWRTTPYTISAGNRDIPEFDRLEYRIDVIRDEYPKIKVIMQRDSLNPNQAYFAGDITDDYGLQSLRLIVHPEGRESNRTILELPSPKSPYHSFYYTYPSGLGLKDDTDYVLYFEATDNDGNRGGKSVKSREFTLRMLNQDDIRRRELQYDKELLDGMGKSARERERLEDDLKELQQSLREKEELGFDDTKRLKDFLERQERQERLMEKFSKELSESMENNEGDQEDAFLKERLERQEAESRKNAALMEEIQKILDKLDRQALEERMEEVAKAQQGNRLSMEQMLELTKRYYVQEKSRQLSRKLNKLAERQDVFSEIRLNDSFNKEEQEKLNEAFNEISEELEELEKENQELQKPLPWERDEEKEESITRDQKEALEEINQYDMEELSNEMQDRLQPEGVRQKQKNAARKMKEISESLDQGASMGGMQTLAEDAEMLRQILDNLIVFSLEQEALFERVQQQGEGPSNRSEDIRKQRELRELFEHVDDSLFALSLRQVEMSETINKQITEVYYNMDRGLENFGENNWYRGASYQQYVITATNQLASYLADILDNMQESMMPGKGQGQGSDFQLPDIIQSQEELQQRMQQSGSKGQEKGEQKGEAPGEQEGEGTPDNEGAGGSQEGQKDQDGKDGRQEGEGNQGADSGKGKEGNEGEGRGASGNGDLEEDYSELFEIYKEQQKIRKQLEEQLKDMIDESDRKLGEQIAREMELFEEEILRNGVTERTADRLNRIQQQLMRLENAALKQGQRSERESKTNYDPFANPILTRPEIFKKERQESEILNRQPLPLRRLYQERVKSYFGANDTIPLPNRF